MMRESPLKVLALCSRPLLTPDGHPISLLDVAEERRRIEAGVKRAGDVARVHFLPEATTGEAMKVLRDGWDVVHFTGHGTEDGRLLLEDGFGVAHLLTKGETTQLFGGGRARLVVLSACHSEVVGRELYVTGGVPAVVAVDARVPIADSAAITFAEHFYGALARGSDAARAFEDARQAVALDPRVGDAHPPLDSAGNPEEPWSKRFKLIGDARNVSAAASSPAPAPGASPAPEAAGNLRRPSANFVGRAREIVDVVKAFDKSDARRVAVWGSGGLGKTELSKAVALWYAERARVGAVLWASASHTEGEYRLRDLASLLGIASRVFGLPVSEQSMFEEQKRVVAEYLAASRALVLLDNWETVEPQHRADLWSYVCGLPEEVRVLVTSRDALPARDARNIVLDTLAHEDAVKLFIRIAHNAGYFERNPQAGAEELSVIHSVCERLSGYPLAVEVVAGQTLSRGLDEIWDTLQHYPKEVLESKDELTGEPRGVWTSLDLSYNVLPEPEQSLFRQMSILLAPAALEDIAVITAAPDARALLDSLIRRSLVRMRSDDAYSILPVIRDYAHSKLEAAGQDPRELHLRAAKCYDEKNALEGSLRASDHLLALAAQFGVRQAAEMFVKYLPAFYYDLVTRGYWAEARSKAEQMIAVARVLGEKQYEARSIGELGSRYQDIGEYGRASELHRKALGLLEELDDKHGVAAALHQLGVLASAQGDYAEAERLYKESLEIEREIGGKKGIAISLHQLGTLAEERGDYAEAERLYKESLEIERELGDKKGIAESLGQLGTLAFLQDGYAEAERLYKESLEISEDVGDKKGISIVLHQRGVLAQEWGDYAEAERLYKLSLEIKKELGDLSGVAITLGQLGRFYYTQGRMAEALPCLLQALTICEELRSPKLRLVLMDLALFKNALGKEQFSSWLGALSTEAERISELIEQHESQEFILQLVGLAEAVAAARKGGSAEEQAELARLLGELEEDARTTNASEIANFFAVLRGSFAGVDMVERLATLAEPFKGIAERALAESE